MRYNEMIYIYKCWTVRPMSRLEVIVPRPLVLVFPGCPVPSFCQLSWQFEIPCGSHLGIDIYTTRRVFQKFPLQASDSPSCWHSVERQMTTPQWLVEPGYPEPARSTRSRVRSPRPMVNGRSCRDLWTSLYLDMCLWDGMGQDFLQCGRDNIR